MENFQEEGFWVVFCKGNHIGKVRVENNNSSIFKKISIKKINIEY